MQYVRVELFSPLFPLTFHCPVDFTADQFCQSPGGGGGGGTPPLPPNNSDSPPPAAPTLVPTASPIASVAPTVPVIAPTPAPPTGPTASAAPTVPVVDALLLFDFLLENSPNQKATDALLDETSKRYEAYLWLVQDSEQAARVREDYQLLQRFALAFLYYAMRGPEWSRDDGWLSGASICEWFGATCADNAMDYLVRLDLSNNNLQRQLPPELAFLQKLRHLDLSNNQINGKLPKALSNITSIGRFGIWLFAALSYC
jgi:Leucine-rich repeat (LRR) protein